MTPLKSFPGGQKQKNALVAAMQAHVEADRMAQDYGYWGDGKGCAVGCALNSLGVHEDDCDKHSLYEKIIGVPREIGELHDEIFECLPAGEAQRFAVDLIDAIPVGADLRPAYHRFMAWMLADPKEGVIRFAGERDAGAIEDVAHLHRRAAAGVDVPKKEWDAPGDAARDAASAAAGTAAGDAAEVVARVSAWSAAWEAAWRSFADRLIAEIKATGK